mgnify:CR=1 FL=1|jgi:hypothetical protein
MNLGIKGPAAIICASSRGLVRARLLRLDAAGHFYTDAIPAKPG